MSRTTLARDHAATPSDLPRAAIRPAKWSVGLIWVVPVLALALAGYYLYHHYHDRGPLINLRFSDATGLKIGQTQLVHRGVTIGQVAGVELAPDQKQVIVHVRLQKSAGDFARQGAVFWIVRPEISMREIAGLGTVLSGPVIDSRPGSGADQTDFTGLDSAPPPAPDGLKIIIKAAQVDRLQAQSPIYYRGIQVGFIQDVQLSGDAATAQVSALILRRYAPLVRAHSQFWVVSAIDVKGGIFTGIQMKVESLRSVLAGGIAFATPEDDMGEAVSEDAVFMLHEDAKKDWLSWAPKIPIEPENAGANDKNPPPPESPRSAQSTPAGR